MTPEILLDKLEEFARFHTKDIMLEVRVKRGTESTDDKRRAANIFQQDFPEPDDKTQKIPYILIQLLNGTDDWKPGQEPESECQIRMVFATYSENGSKGAADLLHLILKVKNELEAAGEVGGNQFLLLYPVEYLIYPDKTPPYHIGEMITKWSLPAIEREVTDVWQ